MCPSFLMPHVDNLQSFANEPLFNFRKAEYEAMVSTENRKQ